MAGVDPTPSLLHCVCANKSLPNSISLLVQEQEARTSLLRDRASKKLVKEGQSHNTSMVLAGDKPRHLNFFADIEEGVSFKR